MAKAQLYVLLNPVSPDRDSDFNAWYNKTHAGEVCGLDGFGGMKRYRAVEHQPLGAPSHQYLAVYEITDLKRAVKALAAAYPTFKHTDAADMQNGAMFTFDPPVYEFKKAKAKAKAKAKSKSKSKSKAKPKSKAKSKSKSKRR